MSRGFCGRFFVISVFWVNLFLVIWNKEISSEPVEDDSGYYRGRGESWYFAVHSLRLLGHREAPGLAAGPVVPRVSNPPGLNCPVSFLLWLDAVAVLALWSAELSPSAPAPTTSTSLFILNDTRRRRYNSLSPEQRPLLLDALLREPSYAVEVQPPDYPEVLAEVGLDPLVVPALVEVFDHGAGCGVVRRV